tara:strand:+ start:3758 stop:4816 length:1059 start_codon:yes stop_codon:yes gene_type:complete
MSSIAVNAITDASAGNTTSINGVTPNANNVVGKNKIINGNMAIDQRNLGASLTPAEGAYTVDRWEAKQTTASKFSVQQSTSSPPVGFTNYARCTSLSAFSVGSSDQFGLRQIIEGLNHYDLDWGTSNAKTITISFWVRSSLTGTFGCALYNYAGDRSYPFTYAISSANTWEKKTVTVAGDTSGTWPATSTAGIVLFFSLGSGSGVSGTAGAWSGSFLASVTGATSVVATSGATFDFTGVQLEAGSSATEFEYRQYGTELGLCQRYYQQPIDSGLDFFAGYMVNGNYGPSAFDTWVVEMRATPTVVLTLGTLNAVGSVAVNYFDKKRWHLNPSANATSNGFYYVAKLTANAEL